MGSFLSIIAVGFFLGMRHATDPDHVIAVTTIVTRQRQLTRRADWRILGRGPHADNFCGGRSDYSFQCGHTHAYWFEHGIFRGADVDCSGHYERRGFHAIGLSNFYRGQHSLKPCTCIRMRMATTFTRTPTGIRRKCTLIALTVRRWRCSTVFSARSLCIVR